MKPKFAYRIAHCFAAALLLFAVSPAAADDERILKELEALRRRVEQLEAELARSRAAALQAAPPAAPAAAEQKAASEAAALRTANRSRLTIGGFADLRFTNMAAAAGDRTRHGGPDFQITRFRPRLSYQVDRHLEAVIDINGTTRGSGVLDVSVRDMFLHYKNGGYYIRVGQYKVPFSHEVFREGSQVRWALERARVNNIMFPGLRDTGILIGSAPRNAGAATFHLAVVNGDGANSADGDSKKSLVARMELPLGSHHSAGASIYSGTTTRPNAAAPDGTDSLVKHAVGLEHRMRYGRVETGVEYLLGRLAGSNVNGGYAQLRYDAGRTGSFFLRRDIFDPREGAPADYWSRTSLGWFRDFTRYLRITAEYDFVRDRRTAGDDDDTFGVELQTSF